MSRRQSDGEASRSFIRSRAGLTKSMVIVTCVALVALSGGQAIVGASPKPTSAKATRDSSRASTINVPDGTLDSAEPSGESPPGPSAMTGYIENYVEDFTGSSIPAGWDVYSGQPGGDPGAQWGLAHVTVSGGMLQLNTWQDPAYGGEWVAGGLCQCGFARTYGAYFVRSKLTGAGPTQVELLWPTSGWPPEIDFDETFGATNKSMATLHWSSANSENHNTIYVDMTQWHTWGVIWTPTSVTYTLDGRVWAQVANSSEVPHQPMTLDIQQQTWCDVATNAVSPSNCPTVPESTLVDWVAEYQSNGSTPPALTAPLTSQVATSITVKSFAAKSAVLTPTLKSQISKLARQISASSANKVVLTGYSDDVASAAASLSISRSRALIVSLFLRGVLESWHVSGVTVSVSGAGSSKPVASNSTPAGRAQNRRVVAVIS